MFYLWAGPKAGRTFCLDSWYLSLQNMWEICWGNRIHLSRSSGFALLVSSSLCLTICTSIFLASFHLVVFFLKISRLVFYLTIFKFLVLYISTFSYCPLVWMFHSRKMEHRINSIHDPGLIYNIRPACTINKKGHTFFTKGSPLKTWPTPI